MKLARKPNVLLIHADQHRKDCLGAYGNVQIRTPHLDALASDGILHRNHYCSFPVCTPSRYSMLSGLYAHQHLGWNNHCTLPGGIPTFPGLLKGAGYKTAAVGKMHFTPTYLDLGFDQMILAEQDGPGRFQDDYHAYLTNLGLLDCQDLYDQRSEYRIHADAEYWESFGARASDLPLEHHSTSYITRQASNVLSKWRQDDQNLLMIGYIKPHHPFDPPAPYSTLYDPDALDLLPGYTQDIHDPTARKGYFDHGNLTPAVLRNVQAMYYGTISHIDDCVGQLIKQLKEQDLYDNTLIVYTSDHGDYLGYHHLLLKGQRMYEPLMNIPLIVKPSEQMRMTAGCMGEGFDCNESIGKDMRAINDQLSSNVDLAGFLLNACGLDIATGMSPYRLTGEQGTREYVLAESIGSNGQVCYMIRDNQYKLILEGDMEQPVFYDLLQDPHEYHDIAKEPGSVRIVERFKNLICQEILFHAPSKVHLDENAPVSACIDQKTIRHRDQVIRDWHHTATGIPTQR